MKLFVDIDPDLYAAANAAATQAGISKRALVAGMIAVHTDPTRPEARAAMKAWRDWKRGGYRT